MTIEERIKKGVADQLGCAEDEIKNESKLIEDLGADSLDLIDMIMSAEEEFYIEIPDDAAEKFRTVGDVIAYVTAHA